ncbi:MAG: DEAD/DEAH box helicase, partial [Dermatophilaceae bacterium]
MPKKAPGAKKARWTAAQKAEARKGPKKPHHRGQPDGPRTTAASTRAASTSGRVGDRSTKPPRSERSPRWDRDDPRRGEGRAPRYSTEASERRTAATANDERRGRTRDERQVRRPHDERPRRERGDRPVRDRGPRVADPARRDRHEGRHAERRSDGPRPARRVEDRLVERRGDRRSDERRPDDRRPTGYRSGERRSGERRFDDQARRTDQRAEGRGPGDRRTQRRPGERRSGERVGGGTDNRPRTFDEAEAQRAEADTWTTYTSSGSGPREVTADNGFAALGLSGRLVERLARDGIVEPFPIQAATIPDALAGRDVLGRGRTG